MCEYISACEGWGPVAVSLKVLCKCVLVLKCEERVCVHDVDGVFSSWKATLPLKNLS